MRRPVLLLAAMLIAGTAAAAPPPTPGDPAADAPPPPPGPREHMPPPPGPGVVVDRRADGTLHVDVRCPPRDAIKECAAIAGDLLAKLNATVQAK